MKILLYPNPAALYERYSTSCNLFHDHLYSFLAQSLTQKQNIEIKTFISEIAHHQNLSKHSLDSLNPVPIKYNDLYTIFPKRKSLQEIFLAFYNNDFTDEEIKKYKEYVLSKLKNWEPDIIITYPMHDLIIKELFPKALCLIEENAIFSRPPFPRTLKFESIHFMNGFLNKYKTSIDNLKLSEKQIKQVEQFIYELKSKIDENNPYKKELNLLKNKYDHLLLLPVLTDYIYCDAYQNDQFTFIDKVMHKIPPNIGVIATFHDDNAEQLNTKVFDFFQKRYPNLIHLKKASSSLYFYTSVDAILNTDTMTGVLGMLFCHRIIALDKTYSAWFADKNDLNNLEQFLNVSYTPKYALIFWYLTHFTVFEKHFNETNWYYNYFKTKLEKFRKDDITFDFYEQIEDFSEISNYILKYVKKYYIRRFIKNLFLYDTLKKIYHKYRYLF